jgi:hypothetical protein
MTYHRVCNKSNTTGTTWGTGTACPSVITNGNNYTHLFWNFGDKSLPLCIFQILNSFAQIYKAFYRSSFDLRLLITTFGSSNFSDMNFGRGFLKLKLEPTRTWRQVQEIRRTIEGFIYKITDLSYIFLIKIFAKFLPCFGPSTIILNTTIVKSSPDCIWNVVHSIIIDKDFPGFLIMNTPSQRMETTTHIYFETLETSLYLSVLCNCFVDRCVVCPSIYGFWLPPLVLQTFLTWTSGEDFLNWN